jgi:hypothetical protein
MRKGWTSRRAALFAGAASAEPAIACGAPEPRRKRGPVLVGRDFARRAGGRRPAAGWLLPCLVGALAAGLLLAILHVSVLRLRYQIGEAIAEEDGLLEHKRAATVAVRELRDPARLRRLAGDLGFARPEHVIEIVPARRIESGPAGALDTARGASVAPSDKLAGGAHP